MSLPVSQYEALLAEVRGLRRKVQRVQQLADPLIFEAQVANSTQVYPVEHQNIQDETVNFYYPLDYTMESLLLDRQNVQSSLSSNCDGAVANNGEDDGAGSEEECHRNRGTHMSVSSEPILHKNRSVSGLYHGTWPVEKPMWNSEPTDLGPQPLRHNNHMPDVNSVMSFASSAGGIPIDRVLDSPDRSRRSSQQLEAKVDMVYSLLAMLGNQEHADMGETLLALSTNPESCLAMRQSGCIPLLVQLVQSDRDFETRRKASQALHNLVHSQPDEKIRKREIRIFRLLEHTRAYTEALRNNIDFQPDIASSSEGDKHPVQTVAHLMKLSFDEGHRQAICQLGGIHVIASLVEAEHANHGSTTDETQCILLRRYACMALTNLTFGDSGNKALLCSYREFMRALVVQLQSSSDELRQVTASVLRNLSWRADATSKDILREVGSVTGLMKAAMLDNKENTLKSILSALWNLSAHCTENKSEICAVEGALGFLVKMLIYKTPSKSLAIIENSGGILRNISSQIAVREDYRELLRQHNCLQILLDQLKSPSLTIVSNACGTLWNLSAKCAVDQEELCRMGAPAMLRSLNYSKHKMIAMGSTAALKNLLSSKPAQTLGAIMDNTAAGLDLPALPTLGARKQKALLQDLDQNLSETYENIEKESPVKQQSKASIFATKFSQKIDHECILDTAEDLSIKFSSLNFNEPSTSYATDIRSQSRIQSFGSSSLPYMNLNRTHTSSPPAYLSVKNKYTELPYDDEIETSDQPIDYSQKYSEDKMPSNNAKCRKSSSTKQENEYVYSAGKSSEQNFTIYAETDLDQPTDYSLRYAEDDSDSDICEKLPKPQPAEFVQDTLKTYCTEDTPYETPCNFSTATSMSDLRIDDKPVIDNDKHKKPSDKEMAADLDEKDHCSTEDISDIESRPKSLENKDKSEFSSGLMSPEKPVNYCEEGTPGCFSRVSSFGSLNLLPERESVKEESVKHLNTSLDETEGYDNKIKALQKSPFEAKAVKFEQVVNVADETPLMFSRSSSLGSLGSAEQNFYPDDRSSVVSDFSRLTSGIISPSELPDSPFQTVPQSPKPRTNPLDYTSSSKGSSSKHQRPTAKDVPKDSVFEDGVTKFKEESTPIQFSTATSLSNLTIDDDINPQIQISEDEDDQDILAACINSGIQNNRYCQKNSTSKLPVSSFKNNQGYTIGQTSSSVPRSLPRNIPPANNNNSKIQINGDCLTTYCTEDTPAALSHAGSNSDLSVLSIPASDVKMNKSNFPSDDSNVSEDSEDLLAQCIQSAMPKSKKDRAISTTSRPSYPFAVRNITAGTPTDCNRRSQLSEAFERHVPSLGDDNSNPIFSDHSPVHEVAGPKQQCSGLRTDRIKSKDGGRKQMSSQCIPTESGAICYENNLQVQVNERVSDKSPSNNNELNHQDSYSSLESTGISEADLALLEQCISLGMQKSKENGLKSMELTESDTALLQQCISSAMPKSRSNDVHKTVNSTKQLSIVDKNCITPNVKDENNRSKNVNVASVAGNMIQANNVCPKITPTVAGVEQNHDVATPTSTLVEKIGTPSSMLDAGVKSSLKLTNSGSDKSSDKVGDTSLVSSNRSHINGNDCIYLTKDDIESCLSRSCEESGRMVDNRMLDPDAMIESLDRFTAELVSQASHLNKEDRFKTSTSDNTWNEDTSPNELTFPSISGSAPNVITFPSETDSSNSKLPLDELDGINQLGGLNEPEYSNDFSSINTSTMTESTLIAIEASKMVTAFQNEAAMSHSTISATSLELEHCQPPSHLNSVTNSLEQVTKENVFKSPKLNNRRKLNGSGLMVKRALSNSLNLSMESLENNSSFNLDSMNPPSAMGDVLDMENSMSSITSLPCENNDVKPDFIINEVVNGNCPQPPPHNPIFNVKQPLHLIGSTNLNSFSDLDHINPPSLFNEITDMCSSLADVNTETICSQTEVFEDCVTHMGDTKTDDDATEFSDANSVTPIQSDLGSSSNESTPKRMRTINKQMTSKQRRVFAKERYKTYTVAAEMVMKEEISKHTEQSSDTGSTADGYKTVNDVIKDYATLESENASESLTYVSPTYSIKDSSSTKLTPREKRQIDPSRFQTQVLDETVTNAFKSPNSPSVDSQKKSIIVAHTSLLSPSQSPARTRASIRQNFIQKRNENKDRFKTQTLEESRFSPEIPSSSPVIYGEADLHLHLQKEANLVLKTLRETKAGDELLDCETLSLVSNDDDSENNSGSSVGYRTYHKSWGLRNTALIAASNVKQIDKEQEECKDLVETVVVSSESFDDQHEDNTSEEDKHPVKPKITKPDGQSSSSEGIQNEEAVTKAVRGRRKPLYSKTPSKFAPKAIKPIKTLTSNLVKNVTSSVKAAAGLKSTMNHQNKHTILKPPAAQSRASSGYGSKPISNSSSSKTSPARAASKTSPKHMVTNNNITKSTSPSNRTPPLERQGTFTKDELKTASKSKIPSCSTSKIPTSKGTKSNIPTSKIPSKSTATSKVNPVGSRNIPVKSASSDRANKNLRMYNRSTSADSRESPSATISASASSHSLKNENSKPAISGVLKKPVTAAATHSNSNSSLMPNAPAASKKQVTSKIASLWKKIEDSKKQPSKPDSRIWIKPEHTEASKLIRSNTFDNKDGVVLRERSSLEGESSKRLSRLGSFVIMDEGDVSVHQQTLSANISA